MQQCNTSQSVVLGTGQVKSEFDQFLNISINDNTTKVFKNFEYSIKYYDADARSTVLVTGIVTGFSGSSANPSILMKYRKEDIKVSYQNMNKPVCNSYCKFYKYCFKLINGKSSKIVTNCPMTSNGADTEKYETVGTLVIPAANIYSVELVVTNTSSHIITTEKRKDEVKIVLLGICATQVRTMLVNMKFIDNQLEDAFKEVNLKVGNRYKIVYAKKETNNANGCNCGNIYEIEGTLTGLEEVCNCNRDPDTSFSIVRTVNCEHPEEIVGLHNSIYAACDVSTDKDKFLDGEPIKTDIKLTFDTTDVAFHGTHDIIMLSQIRDVELISNNSDGESCGCENCSSNSNMSTPKQIFTIDGKDYILTDGYIYEKDDNGCCSKSYKLEDVLKFYFS